MQYLSSLDYMKNIVKINYKILTTVLQTTNFTRRQPERYNYLNMTDFM